MRLFFLSLLFSVSSIVFAQNPLMIPGTLSGEDIDLVLQNGTHEFFSGQLTNTMGANGDILGPTIILDQGQQVNFTVENQLGETTTVHWHGMHVAPENDGGPHTTIADGSTWSPSFTVMDKASTFWYHPHLHEHTDIHVSKGLAGLIIVRDDEEAALDLPRTYGVDDIPLVIQTKDFDSSGQILAHSNSDDVAMVNATIDPFHTVPAQVVRLRLLNGSSQRTFELGMDNGVLMHMIASDGGLLNAPVSLTRLRLSPGERAEVLVDLSAFEGQSVHLNSYASELPNGIYGAGVPGMMAMLTLDGYDPNNLNGTDFQLLELQVTAPSADPVTSIPAVLADFSPLLETDSDLSRALTFTPTTPGPNQLNGDFLINGAAFNMSTINYEIPLGNTEIWTLTNQSGISHPFHIHDVQFFILSINGAPPPAHMQGLKDVVLVPQMGTVEFITVFEDFANEDVPYMYHCHMLPHEDGGMMGQFIVVDQANALDELANVELQFYPNPAHDQISLVGNQSRQWNDIQIIDASGRVIKSYSPNSGAISLNISDLKKGLYTIRATNDQESGDFKFIKK
ncbi:MAG: multicopper oxidase domain-containing protein [Flavobacteriales bacterium]|nr:multicopper oxidase domain-containing protein [Flavobacteriales bacterium]